MNKQQLASKIWESANKMRSKIEANEYKDYILGFIFYKYVSDYQVKFLKANDYDDELLKEVNEEDEETVQYVQQNIGYFISYENLFSTWILSGKEFDVSNVRDALSAFGRLIYSTHKKVFDGVFRTLETGLSKLGGTAGEQTKAINGLLALIKDIPMDGKQDYDVLGFIYEYLISMFAANAGKKAGEFYTPHEVSVLMSDIVAEHLKNKSEIKIFDPTSGSGSLLINIGQSVAKFMPDENNIKYYAQELKENTYNLTRMNLVMRGIKADNIVPRNGDTLEQDWPFFEDNDPSTTYEALYVDAVVSNPPYSQAWDPTGKDSDPRYVRFGLAPKTKADYAFLLHDLYHLKPDGIMTIVLPHGVLFRGGEEGNIRKNLIENNHIDTIIGLPANIFFGTGIPTIVMVLKQKRENNDILIIDASKGFVKEGKNNKLQASHIKKIVDTVIGRASIPKYSRLVSKKEVRENEYNLNIPRYIDSSEKAESYDIYTSMFGGIPKSEVDELSHYWEAFPHLKESLFTNSDTPYVALKDNDIKELLNNHRDIADFRNTFDAAFHGFDSYLKMKLIEGVSTLVVAKEKSIISDNIFHRVKDTILVDKYNAYQLFDDSWQGISGDIELIQNEGFACVKQVDPHMILKKKGGIEVEVQDGYIGHILPFDLVQKVHLKNELKRLYDYDVELVGIKEYLDILIDNLDEEQKESNMLNDGNDEFNSAEVTKMYLDFQSNYTNDELVSLKNYLNLGNKKEKMAFIEVCNDINWVNMEKGKDGTYGKNTVNAYIKTILFNVKYEEGTIEWVLNEAMQKLEQQKELKKQIKKESAELHLKTKEVIENLSDDEARILIEMKWIAPLISDISDLTNVIITELVRRIEGVREKYATTYMDTQTEIEENEKLLCSMIDELVGEEFDMKGLAKFKELLGGCLM